MRWMATIETGPRSQLAHVLGIDRVQFAVCVGFCVSDVAIPFSDTMRNIVMLSDRGLSNRSNIYSSSIFKVRLYSRSAWTHSGMQQWCLRSIQKSINQFLQRHSPSEHVSCVMTQSTVVSLVREKVLNVYLPHRHLWYKKTFWQTAEVIDI
jgi:hypothetical protein